MDYEKVLDLLQQVYEELGKGTNHISRMNWKYELGRIINSIKDRSKYVRKD